MVAILSPSLGGERLHDAAQPREHGQAAVLKLLNLELFEVARLGEAERVEAAARGDVALGELRERVLEDARTVGLRGTDEEQLKSENGPEARVSRAFRRERRDGARELIRHGGAVVRRAQRPRGEPRNPRTVLRRPSIEKPYSSQASIKIGRAHV